MVDVSSEWVIVDRCPGLEPVAGTRLQATPPGRVGCDPRYLAEAIPRVEPLDLVEVDSRKENRGSYGMVVASGHS